MHLEHTAPDHVRDIIAALGRTEDVKFSPSNRRLAVASLLRNQITAFDLSIDVSPDKRKIRITDAAIITSSHLKQPHGVDFIDEEKIIVANRYGDATIFELPSGGGGNRYELVPLEVIRCGDVLNTPGNVSITNRGKDVCEALICSNYGNKVTKHLIDHGASCSVRSSEILLEKWLDVPDGVSVSEPWIAISNHGAHCVLLYENTASLNRYSDPDGILRAVRKPHGVRFTSDGRFLLVADYGTPYVHIYMKDSSGWRGVRTPAKSIRVLSDEDFLRGPGRDGGVKGIDIDHSASILVTTCKVQSLAFFDLAEVLEWLTLVQKSETHGSPALGNAYAAAYEKHRQDQAAFEIRYELDTLYQSREAVTKLQNRLSWRVGAPLRWVGSLPQKARERKRFQGINTRDEA